MQGLDALEEVKVSWVFCHFVQYSISDTNVVVLALSQVSGISLFIIAWN